MAKTWSRAIAIAVLLLAVPVGAQDAASGAPAQGSFSAGKALTFLFLAIWPFPVIPGFAILTAGRDRRFKLGLALYGAAAIIFAATMGVSILQSWGVSMPALTLAAGLLLLLVALKPLLEIQSPLAKAPAGPQAGAPLPAMTELAFSPLAFPMIIPPFGLAIIILLLTLSQERGAMAAVSVLILFVLVLDFLAMVFADSIMRLSALKHVLRILGTIICVLQVSLAVQAIADSSRTLNIF